MSANDWEREMFHLMELFRRESTISLRKINRCFVATGRPFEEVFRQYFLKISTSRLNNSFDTILLERCHEDPAQVDINDYQNNESLMNSDEVNLEPLNILQNEILLKLNVENGTDIPIEIADSDEDDINETLQLQAANDEIGSQTESNGNEVLCHDDHNADDESSWTHPNNVLGAEVHMKREPKIETELEMINLPMIEFDPTENDASCTVKDSNSVVVTSDVRRLKIKASKVKEQFKRNAAGVFKCEDCDYSTQKISHFKSHRLIHDIDAEIFQCEECEFATRYKRHLKRHQRTHIQQKLMGITRNSENDLYKCALCDRQFVEWRNLKIHRTLSHKSNQRVYNCKHCLRRFAQQIEKDGHEVWCHNRLYECYRCKKYKAKKVTDLRDHLRTHSDAKPFVCAICKKAFRQKKTLRRHSNSIHGHIST